MALCSFLYAAAAATLVLLHSAAAQQSFMFTTYNPYLDPLKDPFHTSRQAALIDELILDETTDVICLQGLGGHSTISAVALGVQEKFPFAAARVNPFSPPALTDPPCLLREADGYSSCVSRLCPAENQTVYATIDPFVDVYRDNHPHSIAKRALLSCVFTRCNSFILGQNGPFQSDRCFGCLTRHPKAMMDIYVCREPSAIQDYYENAYGSLILSKYPLTGVQIHRLPGVMGLNAMISAIMKPYGFNKEIAIACVQLTEQSSLPYLGAFGSYADERMAQVDQLITKDMRRDRESLVIMARLGAGPQLLGVDNRGATIQTLIPLEVDLYNKFLSDIAGGILRNVFLEEGVEEGYIPDRLCNLCPDNPMYRIWYGQFDQPRRLTNHVFVGGALSPMSYHTQLSFTNPNATEVKERLNQTVPVIGNQSVPLSAEFGISAQFNPHRFGMLQFAGATYSGNWTHTNGWTEEAKTSTCDWFGVACDRKDNVYRLFLDYNGLSGTLPDNMDDIAMLERLSLHSNRLTGSLPNALGNQTLLRQLFLHNNLLSGTIPPFISRLASLEKVYLFYNNFYGSIPESLYSLRNLTHLYLSRNMLTGTLSPSIRNLRRLISLDMHENDFSGPLPDAWDRLLKLKTLRLDQNHFTGTVPESMCDLLSLERLVLDSNELTGTFPACIGLLPDLQIIRVNNNYNLTGGIPDTLGHLTLLEELSLSNTAMNGTIPMVVWTELPRLQSLRLDEMFLSDTLPAAVSHLTNLQFLFLNGNPQMHGALPSELSALKQLLMFHWYNDETDRGELSGTIPSTYGQLPQLRSMRLSYNSLTGPIPPQLGDLPEIFDLFLNGNGLSGTLPPEIGLAQSLRVLDLSHNDLTGTLPEAILNLENLRVLNLENNRFSGPIWSAISRLENLQELYLSNNQFTGAIPPSIAKIGNLSTIHIDNNLLTGTVPVVMAELEHLQHLHVHRNYLVGGIPDEVQAQANLQDVIYEPQYEEGG